MPQLEAALDRLQAEEAREHEARRIARMIHDHVGQLATAACLAVDDLARDLPEGRRSALARLSRCVTALEEGLRGFSRELHGGAAAQGGLRDALVMLIGGFRVRLGIDVAHSLDGCADIEGRLATAVYRIVQEALTNVARHARASRVLVAVHGSDDSLRILVRDDGMGLPEPLREGLGLPAIRERVRALGGSLTLRSPSHGGTELSAVLPIGGETSLAIS